MDGRSTIRAKQLQRDSGGPEGAASGGGREAADASILIHRNKSVPKARKYLSDIAIQTRLTRAAEAKADGRKFAAFFERRDPERAQKLRECATWMLYRRYFQRPEKPTVLAGGNFCKQHLLCGFCAAGRAARNVQQLREKIDHVMGPGLVPYMVTLTAKNRPTLAPAVGHVLGAYTQLVQRRRNARKGKVASVMGLFAGGVVSLEVKRGKAGDWHPHLHGVFLGPGGLYQPYWERLKREWAELLGQSSASVQLRPIKDWRTSGGMTRGLVEVLKYAVKWEPGEYSDRYEAAKVLRGVRAVRCFGNLYGLKLTDDVTDDLQPYEGEEFEELCYCFLEASGAYVQTKGPQEPFAEFAEYGGDLNL